MRISNRLAVDFFYGGRDSYLVRRAECEFRVQRCRIGSQQANRTIVLQYVVIWIRAESTRVLQLRHIALTCQSQLPLIISQAVPHHTKLLVLVNS